MEPIAGQPPAGVEFSGLSPSDPELQLLLSFQVWRLLSLQMGLHLQLQPSSQRLGHSRGGFDRDRIMVLSEACSEATLALPNLVLRAATMAFAFVSPGLTRGEELLEEGDPAPGAK